MLVELAVAATLLTGPSTPVLNDVIDDAPEVLHGLHELVEEEPTPAPVIPAAPVGSSIWDLVAECEGSSDWSLVTTGNGYYFVLQFDPGTWLSNGGTQAELDAGVAPSRARLIEVAENVLASQGPDAWPRCFP